MMYGQMTAGSWIYIGTQGILQGTYETFAEAGRQHFGGEPERPAGPLRGPGRHGRRAAAGRDDGRRAFPRRRGRSDAHRERLETRYLDEHGRGPRRGAGAGSKRAQGARQRALGRAWSATRPRCSRSWSRAASAVDLVTDQTSRARSAQRLHPDGHVARRSRRASRSANPRGLHRARRSTSMGRQVGPCWRSEAPGAVVFDYGNNIRAQAVEARRATNAFDIPGFVPEYIRPLFCEGQGAVPLGGALGRSRGHPRHRPKCSRALSRRRRSTRWLKLASERVAFQGLPARICWLGYGERARRAWPSTIWSRTAEVKAPIVIGRDHLDMRLGGLPQPRDRGHEGWLRRRRRLADPQRAGQHRVNGASWVSFHHGGGVGIGYSLHAGQVIVADGTGRCRRLERVLTNDPGMGVMRHADAGYEDAQAAAKKFKLKIPK